MNVWKNIWFLRTLFILSVLALFLASCRSKKSVSETNIKDSKSSNKALTQKYAGVLGVSESSVENLKLYRFIDEWYGVPYKYAGFDKNGIDCSGFANKLYEEVYSKKAPRSTKELYDNCKEVKKKDLQEGDFVFFKIETSKVSHVGVYLQNNKFVHASTKKGVMVNDLNEAYYSKYYFSGGRLKP